MALNIIMDTVFYHLFCLYIASCCKHSFWFIIKLNWYEKGILELHTSEKVVWMISTDWEKTSNCSHWGVAVFSLSPYVFILLLFYTFFCCVYHREYAIIIIVLYNLLFFTIYRYIALRRFFAEWCSIWVEMIE
jgi:hypothetical protein